MRVTRNLILAIVASIVVFLALNAYSHVRRETAIFEADTRRDHEFIGRTLRAPFIDTYRSEGRDRAFALIRAADHNQAPVRVRAVRLDGGGGDSRPLVDTARLRALGRGEEVHIVERGRSLTYVPVEIEGRQDHALELYESTTHHDRYVRESIIRNVVTAIAIVAICGIVASALGYRIVGRPLGQLADKARRVGAGDLGRPLELSQDDEIGELAREMNAMCTQIETAQLEAREQTAARITALEQLRHADRLRTVGQLASGLAHEIGTPLNVVLGRARLLASGESTPEEVKEYSEIVVEQTNRMTGLIRQLLDFARRRGPSAQTVDLRDVVSHAAQLLAPMAQRSQVALETDSPETPVLASVDPSQIQQVVTNLAVNAIQAMGTKGGRVTITTGERVATPPPDHVGGSQSYRFVEVIDEGPGISAPELAHVFEPFYTTKDVGEGTGLGLSVAHGIARDHGGWISVESELGRGACFTLYVPRGRASVLPSQEQSV